MKGLSFGYFKGTCSITENRELKEIPIFYEEIGYILEQVGDSLQWRKCKRKPGGGILSYHPFLCLISIDVLEGKPGRSSNYRL